MDLIQFIGFIVSFAAFVYLMFRRAFEKIKRNHPEEETEHGEENPEKKLREFLKSLDADMEEDHHLPEPLPPPPVEKKNIARPTPPRAPAKVYTAPEPLGAFATESAARKVAAKAVRHMPETDMEEKFKGKSVVSSHYADLAKLEQRYEVYQKSATSRGALLLAKGHIKQDMVVLHEIMGRPKAFASDERLFANKR